MPANWASHQKLFNGRVEWPTGPMTGLHQGFAPKWVEAWVVQGTGWTDVPAADASVADPTQDVIWQGPSQSTAQSSWSGFVPNQWTAAEPGWRSGNFSAGPALGITLLAMRSNGAVEFDWWVDGITLF
jgi:hypothetical protein